MTILLRDIWLIENTSDFKIHFARHEKGTVPLDECRPLDVWVRDKKEWQEWQETYPGRNDFNRQYIFSLMEFHHEPETWLFGGVFKVLGVVDGPAGKNYKVELKDMGSEFIGRLKIKSSYNSRPTRINMDTCYSEFEVKEILSEPYSGQAFPGFEYIDISFGELESLIRKGRLDWKTALENVKGIYLLTDTKTGKRYVGSVYGEGGVWSRWGEYIETGHGENVAIRDLIKEFGLDHCKNYFRFALLEHRPSNTSEDKIKSRETYWKNILFTRGDTGLNRN